jgi:predicted nucleic acid-binding protein
MILLDTNIVSEMIRPRPSAAVDAWLNAQPWTSLYLCTPVLAELRFGVERLASGRRQNALAASIDRIENEYYRDRILSFDTIAAGIFARIAAQRERQGRRMEPVDGLIAAIALSNSATFATRDINDFSDLGLDLINPFEFESAPK